MEGITELVKKMQALSQQSMKSKERKKYKCDICQDVGMVLNSQTGAYRKCECRLNKEMQKLWEKSGLKTENNTKTFGSFETWNDDAVMMKKKAIEYYKSFQQIQNDRVNSIMLLGASGSGKTHLSLALANNFIEKKKKRVVYMSYRDIVSKLKRCATDEVETEKITKQYRNAEILLIDDLFKGKITDSDINIAFELINYRYINYLPVMISSELSIKKLSEIDMAIAGRLVEMSGKYRYEVKDINSNYRLKGLL